MAVDRPEPLLIYMPGVERDRKGSVLMELELAGDCYEPQLKRLARNVLRKRYTDGVIDEMLRPGKTRVRGHRRPARSGVGRRGRLAPQGDLRLGARESRPHRGLAGVSRKRSDDP